VRRQGSDLTIVTWGRCTIFSNKAAERLATEDGIDCEVMDLRTIVPPDLDAVLASVSKTGRLLVVHEDRVFASVGREIQGAVHEAMVGEPIVTRVLGQDPVPGIPQNVHLEDKIAVNPDKIVAAAKQVLAAKVTRAPSAASEESVRRPPQVLWTPNRNFVT
jgi:2-oxoisovalerate dehydrogenase E1 component